MARRTSSRAASHDQASSPPTASRQAPPNPPKRATRSTRSQSRDLDDPRTTSRRSVVSRTERQGSLDSVASDASTNNASRGKKARGITSMQPDLSIVAEGEELEESHEGEDEAQEFARDRHSVVDESNQSGMPQRVELLEHPARKAPEPERSLLPAAKIRSSLSRNRLASPGENFYKSSVNVHFLLNKTAKANAAPPSDQQQLQRQDAAGPSAPRTPQNIAMRKLPWTVPPQTSQGEHPEVDENRPLQDPPAGTAQYVPLSTQQMATLMMKSDAEKNKENRPFLTHISPQVSATIHPTSPQRKSFIDRQANAHRVTQISDSDTDSQLQTIARQPAKRTRQESELLPEDDIVAAVDEDDLSDRDFEQDPNQLPDRMRSPPPEIISVGGARKRTKVLSRVVTHGSAADVKSRQPRIDAAALRRQQQVITNEAQGRTDFVPPNAASDGEDMDMPTASYRDVRETAQLQAQAYMFQTGAQKASQTRVKWSDDETDGFLDLIIRFGCSWAYLLEKGTAEGIFHSTRNQVSLKDKARNMKVDFLVSSALLPKNFDNIALSQKEKDKVISKGMNPYRKEGERVGQEMLDMDGNLRDVFD